VSKLSLVERNWGVCAGTIPVVLDYSSWLVPALVPKRPLVIIINTGIVIFSKTSHHGGSWLATIRLFCQFLIVGEHVFYSGTYAATAAVMMCNHVLTLLVSLRGMS